MPKSHFDGSLLSITVSKILYSQMRISIIGYYLKMLIRMTEDFFLNKVKL